MADNTSYAIPKDGISVTSNGNYAFVEIPRICGNCKHGKHKELGVIIKEVWFDCYNQNVEEYWADSEGQLPRFPDGFGCIYWEAKESEGGET